MGILALQFLCSCREMLTLRRRFDWGTRPGVCGSCYERGEGDRGGAVSGAKSGDMLGSKLCGTASDGEQINGEGCGGNVGTGRKF